MGLKNLLVHEYPIKNVTIRSINKPELIEALIDVVEENWDKLSWKMLCASSFDFSTYGKEIGDAWAKEYKNILTTYIENDDGGILMVSTHTWHLAYNISKCKKLPPKQVRENIYKIHDLLAYLESKGARITPIAEYLKQKGFSKG